jgi:hypothetical protein
VLRVHRDRDRRAVSRAQASTGGEAGQQKLDLPLTTEALRIAIASD